MGGTFVNPVIADGGDHGDPFVLRHREEYFLYHTTNEGDAPISVHRSRDLVRWEPAGYALAAGGEGHWAQTDLWAPEVMYWRGTFYMYVAGTTLGPDGEGVEAERRQGVARSDSPLGPFRLDPAPLVPDTWSIDGHPFQDEDGQLWLFYNVRTEMTRYRGRPGSGTIVDRLLSPTRLEGNPTPVAFPSAPWEGTLERDAYWNEGSWVLKRRGRYYHLYSGGFYRDATYGIGVTAANHPRGPWHKDAENPIFHSGRRITGPGHHSVILGPDGVTTYAVYHGYDGDRPGRKVNLDPVRWCGNRPLIGFRALTGRPTEAGQPVPPGPVYDAAVPFWQADLWIEGTTLTVDGVEVALGAQAAPWRVRVNQGLRGLRVWVDGEVRHQEDGRHRPEFGSDGTVAAQSLCSHVADETVHWLPPRERNTWTWGGTGPAELALAVHGTCHVRIGAAEARLTSPVEEFALLRMHAPKGGDAIVVTGEANGARVTDLFVAAR